MNKNSDSNLSDSLSLQMGNSFSYSSTQGSWKFEHIRNTENFVDLSREKSDPQRMHLMIKKLFPHSNWNQYFSPTTIYFAQKNIPKISLGDGIIAGSNLTIGKISELALEAFSYLLHHYVPRGFYDILFKCILPAWRFKQWIVHNEILYFQFFHLFLT